MKTHFERRKGYALALLAAALVLLALSTAGLEGRLLSFSGPSRPPPASFGTPIDRFGEVFSARPVAEFTGGEVARDVFLTHHFDKPPPAAPPPAKPQTRTLSLSYLGELASSGGERRAFVRIDDNVKALATGETVVADWAVSGFAEAGLLITNALQTNTLPFRQVVPLTVPAP